MQGPKIKICGMTDIDNISKVLFLEPDYLGFIFYPKSPRYVVGKLKPEMLSIIPENVKRVGVFVDCSEAEMRQTAQAYGLKVIQLHGDEKPTVCMRLREEGYEVIKAFNIGTEQDFEKVWAYNEHVDYFLFDTKTPGHGGSGQQFDWQLILRQPIRKPWFLSGGISPENIVAASQTGAAVLDLNSKFEVSPGIKDYERLRDALAEIR